MAASLARGVLGSPVTNCEPTKTGPRSSPRPADTRSPTDLQRASIRPPALGTRTGQRSKLSGNGGWRTRTTYERPHSERLRGDNRPRRAPRQGRAPTAPTRPCRASAWRAHAPSPAAGCRMHGVHRRVVPRAVWSERGASVTGVIADEIVMIGEIGCTRSGTVSCLERGDNVDVTRILADEHR
jgi:hypothetical protein